MNDDIGDDYDTPLIACPFCGSENDAAMKAGGVPGGPEEGNASICAYCRKVGIYVGTPPTALRKPTKKERARLKADPRIQLVRATLKHLQP